VSLECANQEHPKCPECYTPFRYPEILYRLRIWDDIVSTYVCDKCGTEVRVTMKRLYDTEVVR